MSDGWRWFARHVFAVPPNASYLIPYAVFVVALVAPFPHHIKAFPAIALIAASLGPVWHQMGNWDAPGCWLLLWSFYILALKNPEKDFRLLSASPNVPPQAAPSFSAKSLLSRVVWSFSLLLSPRLNYWHINETYHDRNQPPLGSKWYRKRWQYCLYTLASMVGSYLLLDAVYSFWLTRDPFFHHLDVPYDAPLPESVSPFLRRYIPARAWRTAMLGLACWSMLSIAESIAGLFFLILNLLSLTPDSWSPHTVRQPPPIHAPLFPHTHRIPHRGLNCLIF